MALPASIVLLASTPKFQIKLLRNQPCQFDRCSQLRHRHRHRHQVSPICFMGVIMPYFGEPNNAKENLSKVQERLQEAVPDSVKNYPWKKAVNILLERLIFLGKEALKWSLVTYFIFSSSSDVIFSISRNLELMIPFGLLVGYWMTDFFKETSQEVFRSSEVKGLKWHLVGIVCFFVLLKFISAYFAVRARVFLLHVANGGLMQVLWLWRSLFKENDGGKEDNFNLNHDAL